jgi:phosphoribosylglycinamide formyltransferase-1
MPLPTQTNRAQRRRLGFLASHGGSNMQAIIDACKDDRLSAEPAVVIGNNSGSKALARARREGIPAYHLSGKTHPEPEDLDAAILDALQRHEVDLVILAGYMRLLGSKTLTAYQGRVLNIHPALLPRFGGKGLYGPAVHEAVLASGDRVTGVTVHVVDEQFDSGPILAQTKVPVEDGDTAESLAARVLIQEHLLFVETLQRIESGELELP